MRIPRILLAAVICLQVTLLCAGTPTLKTITFFSKALDKNTTYIAALPDPLEPGRKYPVLYLLHGAWGNYSDWTQNTSLTEELRDVPMIVVTPDGGQFGWYLDSPLDAHSQYETYVTEELLKDVESRFPTNASRAGRSIAGLSMGGHGALSLAARHPDLFGSASSMSGILHLQNHPGKWELDKRLGRLPQASDEWARHSVYDLVDRFTSAGVALLLDCGTSDSVGALKDNRQVHERLSNRGIRHEYHEFPGTHNWEYWSDRLPEHIAFHLNNFERPSNSTGSQTAKKDHYRDMALAFEKENATDWEHDATTRPIVFLGSSSFEILNASKLFPGWNIANRGISGDRIGLGDYRGILHRLYCSVFDCHPRSVFILNGTNDLVQTAKSGRPTVDEVANCFGEVVQRIKSGIPDCEIVVVSCTPTRDKLAAVSPFIKHYNDRLIAIAQSNHIPYIDTYSAVVGADGLLKPEYSRDGLHLSPAGYELLRQEFLKVMH